jgi:hypothetical protein
MKTKFYEEYEAPNIEIIAIAVEAGFEASSDMEDPWEDDTEMWG